MSVAISFLGKVPIPPTAIEVEVLHFCPNYFFKKGPCVNQGTVPEGWCEWRKPHLERSQ